jgi:hypothetical protein
MTVDYGRLYGRASPTAPATDPSTVRRGPSSYYGEPSCQLTYYTASCLPLPLPASSRTYD